MRNNKYFLFQDKSQQNFKINVIQDKENCNFSVSSIALRPPKKLPKHLSKMDCLDFFCPTYDMLVRYKKDSNWESYKKDYYALIKKRKESIRTWMESLRSNHIYFLCCWENTNDHVHCHRELLYKAFCNSTYASNKIIPIYRRGERNIKKDHPGYNYEMYGLGEAQFPANGLYDIWENNSIGRNKFGKY